MKNYQLKISTLVLFLFSFLMNAQNFQGEATYFSKTTLDVDFAASGIPADHVKKIKERMKSNLEKTYKFTFNKTTSIYKQEEQLEQQGGGSGGGKGKMRMMSFGGNTGNYYKNIQTKTSTKESEFSGKNFLVKDNLISYEWQMEQDTKMIGNYMCFKATTIIERQARSDMKFGRKSPEERKAEEEKAKELENVMEVITVTAWYTMDIPVSNGPSDYWGLPGLILEIDAGETKILCTKIVLNPKETITISEPTKGKEVSQDEYDTIVKEKTKEMKERFQNERQKSGGGHMRM